MSEWSRSWLVAVALLCGIGTCAYGARVAPIPLERELRLFPAVVGGWHGESVDPSSLPLRVPGAQDELARLYRNAAGRAASVYVGYFESQVQHGKLVDYRSKQFHQGAVETDIPTDAGQRHRINRVVLSEGRDSRVVFFWYHLNGEIVASRYQAKLATTLGALIHGRTNGAFVAVSVEPVRVGEIAESADEDLAFVRQVLQTIHVYLHGSA